MHGKLLERTLEPGSLEWLRAGVSASRIPIIMGTVPPSWGPRAGTLAPVRGNLPVSTPATDAGPRPLPRTGHRRTGGGAAPLVRVEHTGTWVHPEDSRFLAPPTVCSPTPPATSRCWRSRRPRARTTGPTGCRPTMSTRRSGRWVFWGTSRSRGRPDGVPGVRLPDRRVRPAAVVRDGSRGDRVPGLTARR